MMKIHCIGKEKKRQERKREERKGGRRETSLASAKS
nr:MAG TPA: hypothetical protein [Caudoviricetes sp.]